MIIPDRKKAMTVMLSKMGEDSMEEAPQMSGMNDLEDTKANIGNDLLHAIKINSAKAVFQALEAAFAVLESHEDSGE